MTPTTEPELLRAFLADRDAACPTCKYNLRNVVGRVCPECGTLITLSVSPVDPLWKHRRLLLAALSLVVAYNAVAGFRRLAIWLSSSGLPIGLDSLVSLLDFSTYLVIIGFALWSIWRVVRAMRRGLEAGRPVERSAIVLAWIVVAKYVLWIVYALLAALM